MRSNVAFDRGRRVLVGSVALGCGTLLGCPSTRKGASDVSTIEVPATKPTTIEPAAPAGLCASERFAASRYIAPSDARVLDVTPTRTLTMPELSATWGGALDTAHDPPTTLARAGSDIVLVGSKALLRSHDGGATFEASSTPISAAAVLGTSSADLYLFGGRSLAHTDDGMSFHVSEPFATDAIVEAAAAEESDFYVAGFELGGAALLAHSRDRGTTWMPVATGIERGRFSGVVVRADTASHAHDVFVFGIELAEGSKAVLLHSHDCGATWLRLPVPGSARDDVRIVGLCAPDAHTLVAATSDTLWRTTDLQTWEPLRTTPLELDAFACDHAVALAAGHEPASKKPHALVSTDAGQTWTDREVPLAGALESALVVGNDTFLAGPAKDQRKATALLRSRP